MDGVRLVVALTIISFCCTAAAVDGGERVALHLYYETLCPGCSDFIVNHLSKLVNSDLISITQLKLIPYGNAVLSNGTINCQHGPWECVLNNVEACAIDAWPDLNVHFPFIYCVESLVVQNNYTYWETCFQTAGLDATPVTQCLNSDRATQLSLLYAAETNALDPPHIYVPWVVVDGQPLYEDYLEFASYICKAYKGTPKPSACTESTIPKLKFRFLKSLFGDGTSKSTQALLTWLQ